MTSLNPQTKRKEKNNLIVSGMFSLLDFSLTNIHRGCHSGTDLDPETCCAVSDLAFHIVLILKCGTLHINSSAQEELGLVYHTLS